MSPRALVSSLPSGLVPGSKRKHPHGPGSCNQHNKCNPFMVLIELGYDYELWFDISYLIAKAVPVVSFEEVLEVLWFMKGHCISFDIPDLVVFSFFLHLSNFPHGVVDFFAHFVQTTPDLKAPFMRMSENEYTIFKLHRLCQWETEIWFCTVWKLCCIFHWGWMGKRFSMCTTSYIYEIEASATVFGVNSFMDYNLFIISMYVFERKSYY